MPIEALRQALLRASAELAGRNPDLGNRSPSPVAKIAAAVPKAADALLADARRVRINRLRPSEHDARKLVAWADISHSKTGLAGAAGFLEIDDVGHSCLRFRDRIAEKLGRLIEARKLYARWGSSPRVADRRFRRRANTSRSTNWRAPSLDTKEALVAFEPEVFFTTSHYDERAIGLVRLALEKPLSATPLGCPP